MSQQSAHAPTPEDEPAHPRARTRARSRTRTRTRTRTSAERAAHVTVQHRDTVDGQKLTHDAPQEPSILVTGLTRLGYVEVRGGGTTGMPNYSSVNCSVAIGMPCEPTLEAAEQMYHNLAVLVERLVVREMAYATGQPVPDDDDGLEGR